MKAITCEMCNSTDILKQDGFFVCQSCGTKYTVEEAKKLMIDGTVEVQGVVEVKNAVQLENLIRLAQKSFDSKNYAQAEEFCNQIIAIDGNNYFAWKLKGEAINYQITATNDRIAEVYSCIMTSYEVLPDEEKALHRDEILESLRVCLEGEIDFALSLFLNNRPTDANLKKVKDTFVSCASRVIQSYRKLGYSEEEAENYKTYIKNYFIKKVNKTCEDCWEQVVEYNYRRNGFTEEYHPTREIFKAYLHEGNNLVDLLIFASTYFTDKTPLADKRACYLQQNIIHRSLVNACSFKRMVSTTTNGYGAVINRREYWELDQTLTSEAKAYHNRRISETCRLYDDTEVEMAKTDVRTREKLVQEWTRQRNAISTGFRLPTGGIIATTMCAVATGIFYYLSSFSGAEIFSLIFAVIFLILTIVFMVIAIAQASTKRKQNLAEIARLNKKIKEVS